MRAYRTCTPMNPRADAAPRKNYRTPAPDQKPERLKPFADAAPDQRKRAEAEKAQAYRDRTAARRDVALDMIRNRYKGGK